MLSPAALRARMRDEHGFTLIEALVAMVTGVVVTGALFAILQFAVHQTSRISQVAQADQVSRTAMTRIVDELHSACLSAGFSPVQEKSTQTQLIFENGYSEQAEVPGVYTAKGAVTGKIEGVREDSIEWAEKTGLLTDTVQLGTGAEENGVYPVSSTKTTIRLGEHVSQASVVNTKKETEPSAVFRYFEYATKSTTGTGEAASTLKEIPLKTSTETLGKTNAAKVAAVQVSFRTGSYTKEVKLGSASEATIPGDLTTLNTFAFSAPNSESVIEAGPCE